jgi:heat shock protein HslJ
LLEDTIITLDFKEGRIGGSAGCNRYGGEVALGDGGSLTFDKVHITEMLCQPEARMKQEENYMQALHDAAIVQVMGDRLEMYDAAGETVLIFVLEPQFPMDPNDLLGTGWQLLSMDGNRPLEGSTIVLVFHDEHMLSSSTACSGYVAAYLAKGDDLGRIFEAMLDLPSSCSEALQAQDRQYSALFRSTTDYRLSGGKLDLISRRGQVLTFEPLSEDASVSLEGIDWTLVAMIVKREIEGMSAPLPNPVGPMPGTEITATFEDGTVRGSAGCNSYRAVYVLDGPRLTVDDAAVTEKSCVDPLGLMDQEQRYLAILASTTTYAIYGRQLWLVTDDGRTLVFASK